MKTTMADMGNLWEDLRRQARQLENEIDLKLVSFSKLGTTYSSHRDFDSLPLSTNNANTQTGSSDTAPLLSKTSSEHMFDTMAMEISQLLSKLTVVNDRMVEYTQKISSSSPSAALLHTLQRHRDILQDYSHEFQKTSANITAMREREDLLGSVHRDINAYKNSSGLNRRSDMYLKENEHIRNVMTRLVIFITAAAVLELGIHNLNEKYADHYLIPHQAIYHILDTNSERLVDEQINIAIATKENFQSQGKLLTAITQRVNSLANRFPVINSLVQRINIRKRRDSIILGLVTAVCIILLLLYAFN